LTAVPVRPDPDAAGAVKILTAGSGFHVETPSAAVFWQAANTVTGNYTLKGTFKLNKPSGHVNFYGLVFGAARSKARSRKYIYFYGRPNGAWLVKTRTGDTTAATFPGARRSGAQTAPSSTPW